MDFLGPVFHQGLNVTVRKGPKWTSVVPGDELDLAETNGSVMAQGRVVFVLGGHTKESIPEYLLEFEHAPGARTLEGLCEGMDRAYGENNWEHDVTIVGFWIGEVSR